MKSNLQIFKYCILLFLGWRVALGFITYFGLSTFPSRNGITDDLFLPSNDITYWFRWTNWDGGHFRGIAEHGYSPQQTVFFPLYPLLMKILNLAGLEINLAGLLISHVSLLLALFFLYKLVLLDFSEKVAKRAVFALLIFPTSFYFASLYSESLFLAATLASFYFFRTKKVGWAALGSTLAVATRLVGVVTVIGALAEHLLKPMQKFHLSLLWNTKLKRLLLYFMALSIILKLSIKITHLQNLYFGTGLLETILPIISFASLIVLILVILEFLIRNLYFNKIFSVKTLLLFLALLPIPLYMLYQQALFQEPFGFLTNEAGWNRHFTMPWEPVLGYLNYLRAVGVFEIGNAARILTELIFFIGGMIGLIFSLYKLRPSYSLFYALSLILPAFSGTLIAMPRYMLIIFPIFILLGLIENELVQKIGVIFFILLLSAYSMLFMGWFWVT